MNILTNGGKTEGVNISLWNNWNKNSPKVINWILNTYMTIGNGGFVIFLSLDRGLKPDDIAYATNWWLAVGLIIGIVAGTTKGEKPKEE